MCLSLVLFCHHRYLALLHPLPASMSMDFAERARRCLEYVGALEEERCKIQVFQRELPLCLRLVTETIETCRQQMVSEEATVNEGPVLEEFIPLKPSSSEGEEEQEEQNVRKQGAAAQEGMQKKHDWLRSVQLWSQDPEPLPRGVRVCKPIAVNVKKSGGAFHPFDRDKLAPAPAQPAAAASSTAETITGGGGGDEKEKEGQSHPQRKARRCWSPELHRRFLYALQQLGGSHAATPKQIRELMKVEGLTNDEVKSHLQKYRLHTRRPSPAVHANSHSGPQAPQFVVVGGLWVPSPEYAVAAAAAAAAAAQQSGGTDASRTEIYAPLASLPSELRFEKQLQRSKQHAEGSPTSPLNSGGSGSRDENSLADDGASKSASPATSSSSRTTTA